MLQVQRNPMVTNTPIPNAFTINRLWTSAGEIIFPLTLSCRQVAGSIHQLDLSALRVLDMCDLLRQCPALVVLDVEGDFGSTLSQEATRRGIEQSAVDADTAIFAVDNLAALLGDLRHYDLTAFDLSAEFTMDDVIASVIGYLDHRLDKEGSILRWLDKSRVFLHSHDDCYLHLESFDIHLLQAVFARTLSIFTGTALAMRFGIDDAIADVPTDVVAALWPNGTALTILMDEVDRAGDQVIMRSSPVMVPWQGAVPNSPAIVIEYHVKNGEWTLTSG
jgi:hypothetical protein